MCCWSRGPGGWHLAFWKPQFMCNLFETFGPQDFSKIIKKQFIKFWFPRWVSRPDYQAGPVGRSGRPVRLAKGGMGQRGKGKASHYGGEWSSQGVWDTFWGHLRLQAQLVVVDLENWLLFFLLLFVVVSSIILISQFPPEKGCLLARMGIWSKLAALISIKNSQLWRMLL